MINELKDPQAVIWEREGFYLIMLTIWFIEYLALCYKVFTLETSSGLIKSPISGIDQYAKVSFGSTNKNFLKKWVRIILRKYTYLKNQTDADI